jgi:hypothetical protein
VGRGESCWGNEILTEIASALLPASHAVVAGCNTPTPGILSLTPQYKNFPERSTVTEMKERKKERMGETKKENK